jgi:hypothetical protein
LQDRISLFSYTFTCSVWSVCVSATYDVGSKCLLDESNAWSKLVPSLKTQALCLLFFQEQCPLHHLLSITCLPFWLGSTHVTWWSTSYITFFVCYTHAILFVLYIDDWLYYFFVRRTLLTSSALRQGFFSLNWCILRCWLFKVYEWQG